MLYAVQERPHSRSAIDHEHPTERLNKRESEGARLGFGSGINQTVTGQRHYVKVGFLGGIGEYYEEREVKATEVVLHEP
jgi:hypothetical protein